MLQVIPFDILYNIVLQLNPEDLISISRTNTEFHSFIMTCEYLWKSLCDRYNIGTTKDSDMTWREWFRQFRMYCFAYSKRNESFKLDHHVLQYDAGCYYM